jgi:transcriptional regulator with XRE-family HTH domain
MNDSAIGKIIHNMRKQKKIPAAKLSRGLCSVSMLSRIESGERYPDKFLFDALIERMGETPEKYYLLGTKNELDSEQFDNKYLSAIRVADNEEVEKSVLESKLLRNEQHKLQKQMRLSEMAQVEKDHAKGLKLYREALKCTIGGFDELNMDEVLLSRNEYVIINAIGVAYHCLGNDDKAIDIAEKLIKYCEKNINDSYMRMYLRLGQYLNISDYYFIREEYKQMLPYVEKGIQESKLCPKSNFMCIFYYRKAYAYAKIGLKEESAQLAPYFYYTCKQSGFSEKFQDSHRDDFIENTGIWFEIK